MHIQIIWFREISCVKNSSLPMSLKSAGSRRKSPVITTHFLLPWLPPKQVQGLFPSMLTLLIVHRKSVFVSECPKYCESQRGDSRTFSDYGQRHSCCYMQRELMAERQMSLPDNSRKRMALSLVGLSAYGTSMGWPAYIWPLQPGQPQSTSDHETE